MGKERQFVCLCGFNLYYFIVIRFKKVKMHIAILLACHFWILKLIKNLHLKN